MQKLLQKFFFLPQNFSRETTVYYKKFLALKKKFLQHHKKKGGFRSKMARESAFQKALIQEIKERFPGCYVLKTDSGYIQGFPDLLILFKNIWAALECKREKNASRRPNQNYYVNDLSKMSYASFVYPENKEEVLDELQKTFSFAGGETRVP